ncbi:hypothetical protein [Brachybacterium hainanense]|uniref:Uncharacterized protein n=1 Tax=Brachybacterium hainanense TaxID=1541174 RepID=A0ABV6R6X4_9MICO
MSSAARHARAHDLGRVLRVYRMARPLPSFVLELGIAAAIGLGIHLLSGLLLPAVGAGLLVLLLVEVLGDVRLVVCERGLLIGRLLPGCSPYRLRYSEIDPRGVACVRDVGRCARATGRSYGSTLFSPRGSRRGVLLDGPVAAAARTRSFSVASLFDTPPDTGRGGKIWAFAYAGRPEALIDLLGEAMLAAGRADAAALRESALPERSVDELVGLGGRSLPHARGPVRA